MRRLADDKMTLWQDVAYCIMGSAVSNAVAEMAENFREICGRTIKRVELEWDSKLRRRPPQP